MCAFDQMKRKIKNSLYKTMECVQCISVYRLFLELNCILVIKVYLSILKIYTICHVLTLNLASQ